MLSSGAAAGQELNCPLADPAHRVPQRERPCHSLARVCVCVCVRARKRRQGGPTHAGPPRLPGAPAVNDGRRGRRRQRPRLQVVGVSPGRCRLAVAPHQRRSWTPLALTRTRPGPCSGHVNRDRCLGLGLFVKNASNANFIRLVSNDRILGGIWYYGIGNTL